LFQALAQLQSGELGESGAPAADAQRVTEHSLLYALIDIGDASAIAIGLDSQAPGVQRAALVALDQLQSKAFFEAPVDYLKPQQVLPLLHHSSPMLRSTAAWIAGHRPQWGEPLADHFRSALNRQSQSEADQSRLLALVGKLARAAPIQELLAEELNSPELPRQLFALRAMTSAGLPLTPPRWIDSASKLLPQARGELLDQSLAAARQWPLPKAGHAGLRSALIAVAENRSLERTQRLEALTAAGPIPACSEEMLRFLLDSLDPALPQADRSAAANALGLATLSPIQRDRLLQSLRGIGPLELPRVLPAFAQGDSAFGRKLIAALPQSAGYRSLRADQVQTVFAKYPAAVQAESAPLLAELHAEAAQEAERLAEILRDLPPGDVSRGHAVFWGKKANCIQCHTLGYAGGRLGPDLTNIGRVRNERDLLEAIVFPSASLVRGYEPVSLLLSDGRSLTGVITRENRTELVLALDAQKTQTIAREEIAEMQPSPISLMPKGLAGVLSKQELADLTAFLKAGAR
jgi:putative heme-binding domain-containing protein